MANLIYQVIQTPIVFQDSSGDAVISLNALAANTGRVSARYDRGATSLARRYTLRGVFDKGAASVVGEIINMYIFTSDGTNADGTVGTADGPLTANQALDCFERPYPVVVNTTSTSVKITRSYVVEIPTRYFSVGVMNSVTGLLRAAANVCTISLTPVADEIQ